MPLFNVISIMRVLHGSQLLQNPNHRSAKTNIRFVLDLSPRTHIGWGHFQMTGWLPMEFRVQQLKLSHMFKIFNKEAPSYSQENFGLVKEHHAEIIRYNA